MYAIRRDLKKGKTFGHWQISNCTTRSKLGKAIEYIDGTKYSLVLKNCYLHNSVATAKRIHNGAYRERCAWIVCDSYEIVPIKDIEGIEVSYNPKNSPHYISDKKNIDKTKHNLITTQNYSIYVCD
tara:strand:+ start:65 stop:442 length:378 start_codon:yes stop_codon:yes gene_type:complete